MYYRQLTQFAVVMKTLNRHGIIYKFPVHRHYIIWLLNTIAKGSSFSIPDVADP